MCSSWGSLLASTKPMPLMLTYGAQWQRMTGMYMLYIPVYLFTLCTKKPQPPHYNLTLNIRTMYTCTCTLSSQYMQVYM